MSFSKAHNSDMILIWSKIEILIFDSFRTWLKFGKSQSVILNWPRKPRNTKACFLQRGSWSWSSKWGFQPSVSFDRNLFSNCSVWKSFLVHQRNKEWDVSAFAVPRQGWLFEGLGIQAGSYPPQGLRKPAVDTGQPRQLCESDVSRILRGDMTPFFGWILLMLGTVEPAWRSVWRRPSIVNACRHGHDMGLFGLRGEADQLLTPTDPHDILPRWRDHVSQTVCHQLILISIPHTPIQININRWKKIFCGEKKIFFFLFFFVWAIRLILIGLCELKSRLILICLCEPTCRLILICLWEPTCRLILIGCWHAGGGITTEAPASPGHSFGQLFKAADKCLGWILQVPDDVVDRERPVLSGTARHVGGG